ncbi:MAG: glycosyltransferase family 4 protein [Pseudomonadota bacterium]
MRIAYLVASSDVSGGQRVIFQQAEALADLGSDITLVCPEPAPTWFPLRKSRWEMSPFDESKALAGADIRVATFWTTVAPAVRDFRGPVFHLCQGYEPDFSFYAPQRREIELAYAKTTHKLAVSPHIAKRLKALGYAPVTYVGQTFNPQEFPPEKMRRFDQTPTTILLVGIFEADVKGIREALEALAEVRRSGTTFRLHRVSMWPLSVEERSIFMPDKYHFRLTPSEMGEIYRRSDLLIGPSHPEEGFGLPVLEALSSGLPALLSDTPGHRHIARAAAEYFPVGNTSAIAVSVARLLLDLSRRADFSAMGPVEAARFRTGDVADRLLTEFRRALDSCQLNLVQKAQEIF